MKRIKNNLMNVINDQDEVVVELILGILILGAAALVVGVIIVPHRLMYALGTILGVAGSIGRTIHMAYSLDVQLDYNNEKDARVAAAKYYGVRYFASFVVMLVSAKLFGMAGLAGTFIGLFMMKPAAMIQPYIRRNVYDRFFRKQ